MADLHLKVSPSEIADLTKEVASVKQQITQSLQNIKSLHNQAKLDWVGPSSQAYSKSCEKFDKRGEFVERMVVGYISTMNDISGIYIHLESTVKAQTQVLPTEGIFL